MASAFDAIPQVVIDYVRTVFAAANDKVSGAMVVHPSMHEESLDHILIMELTASPPAFFSSEQVGVSLQSHWLGGRWMYRRWEIADIAFFILLRRHGKLLARKVALLQTKRLYSREIPAVELEEADYVIGIGRLVDQTEPTVPISNQRRFSFERSSLYQATQAEHEQLARIDAYSENRGIPVYYGFYNPPTLPFQADYPTLNGQAAGTKNDIGCRVLPADHVHGAIRGLKKGQSPSVDDVAAALPYFPADHQSTLGWRLENFVADEILRCRQGRIFDDRTDPNLRALLYERSAPIAAAITITVDIGGDG
jgi:hypothetical protein